MPKYNISTNNAALGGEGRASHLTMPVLSLDKGETHEASSGRDRKSRKSLSRSRLTTPRSFQRAYEERS